MLININVDKNESNLYFLNNLYYEVTEPFPEVENEYPVKIYWEKDTDNPDVKDLIEVHGFICLEDIKDVLKGKQEMENIVVPLDYHSLNLKNEEFRELDILEEFGDKNYVILW